MNSPGVAETLLLSFAPAIKSVGESKEHAAWAKLGKGLCPDPNPFPLAATDLYDQLKKSLSTS